MINAKAALLFVLALGLGTVAAMMAHRWIQSQASPGAEAESGEFAQVYVAAREIPYGQTLDSSYVKLVPWPRDAVPDGVVMVPDNPEGKLVNQSILPGEPIMSARVVEKLAGSRLSAIVTPTKRAISVRVNDVAGVAGFLLPGNRVDVLATRIDDQRRAITRTLLQNIKVLAVDQKASPDKDEPIVVRAVTLEAELDQARELASATEEGSIQLVLRNPVDNTTSMPATGENLEPSLQAAQPVKRYRPRSRNVTVIRGTQVSKTKVRL